MVRCEEPRFLATADPDSKDETFFIEEDGILRTDMRRIRLRGGMAYEERVLMYCSSCGTEQRMSAGLSAGVQH